MPPPSSRSISVSPSSGPASFSPESSRSATTGSTPDCEAAGAAAPSSERSSSISPSLPITTRPRAGAAGISAFREVAPPSVVITTKGSSSPVAAGLWGRPPLGSAVSIAGFSISTGTPVRPAAPKRAAVADEAGETASAVAASSADRAAAGRPSAAPSVPACPKRGRASSSPGDAAAGRTVSPTAPDLCRTALVQVCPSVASAPSAPSPREWVGTTRCLTISTIRPPLSTTALPAELTVLMKLRLMNTPVRIHPPSSTSAVPTAPIPSSSIRAASMPRAPPQPLLAMRLNLSPNTNPSVSDPRIMMRKRLRIEWLNISGLRRMIRTPTSISITGSRMPNKPNPRPAINSPSHAPERPHRFSTEPSKRGSSAPTPCSTLRSLRQQRK